MSLVLGILAVLGVALIILLAIYIYHKYNDNDSADSKNSTSTTPDYPPDEYMQEVGTKCPDLWTLSTKYKDGSYLCENTNNVPVYNKDTCPPARFNQIKKWPLKNKQLKDELKSRCDWIEKCGPAEGVPASWIGIDDLC